MAPQRHVPFYYLTYSPIEFIVTTLQHKCKGWQKNRKRSINRFASKGEENIKGKVVVITGANSGLGKCAATEMAKRGAVVVMGCRDLAKGELARKDIMEKTGSSNLKLYRLDLSDLSSVRSFAQEVLQNHLIIDILINNAGVSLNSKEQQLTKEGWDLQMTTNHLGHFLLTRLLINSLLCSPIARVVNVSSTLCVLSTLDTRDIMLTENLSPNKLGFWCSKPYQNSKLANALFTKTLATRYPEIKVYSMCPGLVRTEIFREYDFRSCVAPLLKLGLTLYGTDVEKGVETVLLCSLGKRVDKDSGGFFRFGKRLRGVEKMLKEEVANDLWSVSEKYVGLIET